MSTANMQYHEQYTKNVTANKDKITFEALNDPG